MTTLPNAELRLKIADWVDDYAETLLGSEYSGKINREECLDGLLELFQAHQQQLLREILSHKQHEYVEGVEEVIDFVPVSVIQSKIGSLK